MARKILKNDNDQLRCQEEERLGVDSSGTEPPLGTSEETVKLQHELLVLRVELEMQNTELRESREKLEAALEMGELTRQTLRKIAKAAESAVQTVEEAAEEALRKVEGLEDAMIVARLKVEEAAKVAHLKVMEAEEVARLKVEESATALPIGGEAIRTVEEATNLARLKVEKAAEVAHRIVLAFTERKHFEDINCFLELRIARAVEELRQKDQMLILQDRLSLMGEMINNIAHQWHQPLNALSLVVQQVPMYDELGILTSELVTKNTQQAMQLIKVMSQTIHDFQNLFKVDKNEITFSVNEVITRTLSLLEKTFENQSIGIAFHPEGNPMATGFPNEYSQVLLNILLNARDALIEQKIDAGLISIHSFAEGERSVVTIADNAGGIPAEIKDKLFDAYFTTKGPEKGTGIGLFMSKEIIEKNMKGSLTVQNVRGGAEFRIDI